MTQQVVVTDGRYVGVSGGWMEGPLVLYRDPQAALEAATKQYVDAQIASIAESPELIPEFSTWDGIVLRPELDTPSNALAQAIAAFPTVGAYRSGEKIALRAGSDSAPLVTIITPEIQVQWDYGDAAGYVYSPGDNVFHFYRTPNLGANAAPVLVSSWGERPVVPVPTIDSDVVNKEYLDSLVQNIQAAATYTHTQSLAETVWTVPHNLGRKPAVHVEDSVGNVVFGSIQHLDVNTVEITFRYPFTGTARCN